MQSKAHNIERARNVKSYPFGDPERWGGSDSIAVVVPTGVASDQTIQGQQLIRAQCEDLVARAWETIIFWTLEGVDPTDTFEAFVEVRAGSGQGMGKGDILVTSSVFAPVTPPWRNTPTSGTVHLPSRIPASALNMRPWVKVLGDGTVPVHTIKFRVSIHVAPRAQL